MLSDRKKVRKTKLQVTVDKLKASGGALSMMSSKLTTMNQLTRKAAEIMVKESTRAYHAAFRVISRTRLTDFGLKKVQDTYFSLLPCLMFTPF